MHTVKADLARKGAEPEVGILEHDAGVSRADAERRAVDEFLASLV